jgi:RNA polymerase sigma factor (sigma-70 family)
MHPRQHLIEMFSTFVQFTAENFNRWAIDARLRRSMQNSLNKLPDNKSENFWTLYWYKLLQDSSLSTIAKNHLVAYLQEACYWTSQKTTANFVSSQYRLSDCFQIAISQVDKVLKGFNPDQGFLLKNYATVIFNMAIRETLRQRQEVDICSDWGLLRKTSQKRLQQSLEAAGLPPATIRNYILAWNFFKELYTPSQSSVTKQLPKPDNQTLEAIVKLYNSQNSNQNSPTVSAQTIETWLLNSAKAVRAYLYPNVASINAPKNSDDGGEWLDNLPSNSGESPLNQIIAEEEELTQNTQLQEINAVLVEAVTKLQPDLQQILKLYYVQQMTQQEIAKELQIQQYTISRRLTKARESLLKSLATWSQEKMHISLDSNLLKTISTTIEEWLQGYYKGKANG